MTDPKHALLMYEVVDDYIERRVPFRAEHLEVVRAADQRGEVVLGGPLLDPSDKVVLVFRGETLEAAEAAAEAFANADPYVRNGLVAKWTVRRWRTVLGDGKMLPS